MHTYCQTDACANDHTKYVALLIKYGTHKILSKFYTGFKKSIRILCLKRFSSYFGEPYHVHLNTTFIIQKENAQNKKHNNVV